MTPFIFKVALSVFLGLSGLLCLIDVAKGKYLKEQKPVVNAISAIIAILIIVGLWVYL